MSVVAKLVRTAFAVGGAKAYLGAACQTEAATPSFAGAGALFQANSLGQTADRDTLQTIFAGLVVASIACRSCWRATRFDAAAAIGAFDAFMALSTRHFGGAEVSGFSAVSTGALAVFANKACGAWVVFVASLEATFNRHALINTR